MAEFVPAPPVARGPLAEAEAGVEEALPEEVWLAAAALPEDEAQVAEAGRVTL